MRNRVLPVLFVWLLCPLGPSGIPAVKLESMSRAGKAALAGRLDGAWQVVLDHRKLAEPFARRDPNACGRGFSDIVSLMAAMRDHPE